jgi:hypothetical protein
VAITAGMTAARHLPISSSAVVMGVASKRFQAARGLLTDDRIGCNRAGDGQRQDHEQQHELADQEDLHACRRRSSPGGHMLAVTLAGTHSCWRRCAEAPMP